MMPNIRDMENGDVVVDYGNKWFRCQTDGAVICKEAIDGKIAVRPATSKERLLVLADAAFGPAR